MSLEKYGFYSMLIWSITGLIFLLAMLAIVTKGSLDVDTILARRALLESLAISSLALTSECDSARNPLEGICNSASDIPGGYPYHSSCDIVNPSKIPQQQLFSLKILK